METGNFESRSFFKAHLPPLVAGHLRELIRTRLIKRHRELSSYGELWWSELQRQRKLMKAADHIRLRILHSQFNGVGVLGLPSMVRAARFVVKQAWRLRK